MLQSLLVSAGSALILVGLLASPTSCGCGTGTPHPHSLFLLTGHHHMASGRHVRLGQTPAHRQMMDVARMDRVPRLQMLAGHASDRIAMLALMMMLGFLVIWRRVTFRYRNLWFPTTWLDRPDLPPPRGLATSAA